ncbi:MAG: glycosyltransferase family 25 protein [Caulobacterales bacterium]
MDCHYINLDSATARRELIERNFNTYKAPGWTLTRFPAVDVASVEARQVPGRLRPAEKACFLSHQQLLGANLSATAPIMILEDDAEIGRRTCALIDNFLASQGDFDWDIVFANVCIPRLEHMLRLAKYRNQIAVNQRVILLDLIKYIFAGADAYIVNHKSIVRLHRMILLEQKLDTPYDLLLQKFIHERRIKGFSYFPFITGLSDLSQISQLRERRIDEAIWGLFRSMMRIDRDLERLGPQRESVMRDLQPEHAKMLQVLFDEIDSSTAEYD